MPPCYLVRFDRLKRIKIDYSAIIHADRMRQILKLVEYVYITLQNLFVI